MSERVNRVTISVPEGNSGTLEKSHRFSFAYDHAAEPDCQLSLTMPVRLQSYSRGVLHPIFEQNLPEGFVRERITEQLRKHIRIDELFFRLLVLSAAVGNGDAHKKNFSLIYEDIRRPETISLAPAYDIVSTLPYLENDTPALKMNGQKKSFPDQSELIRFGKKVGINKPSEIIEQVIVSVSATLHHHQTLLKEYPPIYKAIKRALSNCAT